MGPESRPGASATPTVRSTSSATSPARAWRESGPNTRSSMSRGATVARVERAADWEAHWRVEPLDPAAADAEERTPRWRAQDRIVEERLGGFEGLRAIEVGAGRGLNGLLYARRGANVTLLDESSFPLEQACGLYAAHGVGFDAVEADVFALPSDLRGAFD